MPIILTVLFQVDLENGTSEWGRPPAKSSSDWVDDVEAVENIERYDPVEADQPPSRPNSRDSRISRGSKDGKMSRSSVEKTKKLHDFEEKPTKLDNPIPEQYDHDKKPKQKAATQDLRGYFRDTPEETKKVARPAPGP